MEKSLRERNKDSKLARIERAARALFARHGFEATTTRQIATRAKIATGTLFLYFPDKRALLLHLFRGDIERLSTELSVRPSTERGVVDQLMEMFGRIYDYYEQDVRLSRVFVKELLFLDEPQRTELTVLTVGFLARIAEVLQAGQRGGEVRADIELYPAAYQCFAVYWLALVGWLGGTMPTRELAATTLRAALDQLLRGIAVDRRRARD